MPFKSSTKTLKKKSLKNTQKKKSGTAKRSNNRSCKGGAKTKKKTVKKTPSTESSDDEDNYFYHIFEEDGRVKRHNVEVGTFATLPTPKYTAESKKEKDIEMYEKAINKFYNERADVQALKAKPTDTKKQREKKKQKFATFPKLIEDSIFNKIEKEMQPELDNWDEQKVIRDKQFGELTDKIIEASRRAGTIDYDMEQAVNDEFNWVSREWKPEEYPHKDYRLDEIEDRQARAYASFNEDGPVAQGDEHNPRTDIEAVLDTRIGNLSRYIETKWHGWEDAKPKSGRKMTDMLVEDFSIPGVVAELDHEEDVWEWHTNNMEIYDIQKWNASWEKANNDEYKESDEFQVDIKKEMKKTNKDRTTVIAELNQNIEKEKKLIRDAEEKEKREIAAAAEKRKRDDEAEESKHNKKQKLRERARMKKAMAEAALRPKPPAQKIRATPMPPAAGDGPTPMTSTEPAPISYIDAQKLANENEHIIIVQSKSNPGKSYMFNNETKVSTWITGDPPSGLYQSTKTPGQYYSINKQGTAEWLGTNELSRVDAENAVQNNPGRFEIRTHNTPDGNFDYLINKETDAVAKIFD